MRNEIANELEEQLNKILEKEYPSLYKDAQDGDVYFIWGAPEQNNGSNSNSLEVSIADRKTNKILGKINFDININWSKFFAFGVWNGIRIISSTLNIKYEG